MVERIEQLCGIVGIFGEPGGKNVKVFTDMLQMDVIRGWDSTGIAVVDKKGTWEYTKNVGLPQVILSDHQVKHGMLGHKRGPAQMLILGHNRAATKGGVSIDNAHPFEHNGIILVHNGTLFNWESIQQGAEQRFPTDSEAICWHISKHGVASMYEKMDGAAMLVWWDDEHGRLNFLSNGKRSFLYGYTEGRKQLVFASEAWFIKGACKRNQMELEDDKLYKVDDHVHWQFRVSRKGRVVGEAADLQPFRATAPIICKGGPERGKTVWNGNTWSDSDQAEWDEQWGIWPSSAVNEPHQAGKLVPVAGTKEPELFTDPSLDVLRKKDIPENIFHKMYDKCTFCKNELTHDYEDAVILDDYEAACGLCSSLSELEGIRMVSGKGV